MASSLILLLSPSVVAQEAGQRSVRTQVRAAGEIGSLLNSFLDAVNRGDATVQSSFWADDLIYTSSSGKRMGKADILKDLAAAPSSKTGGASETFEAEDVQIRQYGDTAVLAFRLVEHGKHDGKAVTRYYLDTGVFVNREGRWQAVAWQATKTGPPPVAVDRKPNGKG